MTSNINELANELASRELLIFRLRFQVDMKNIKCPLQWWDMHESMFPTIGFLAH
jgi:hypothetical protein